MFKRIATLLFAETETPFGSYYNRLLNAGKNETAPTIREAQRDFRATLRSRYPQTTTPCTPTSARSTTSTPSWSGRRRSAWRWRSTWHSSAPLTTRG